MANMPDWSIPEGGGNWVPRDGFNYNKGTWEFVDGAWTWVAAPPEGRFGAGGGNPAPLVGATGGGGAEAAGLAGPSLGMADALPGAITLTPQTMAAIKAAATAGNWDRVLKLLGQAGAVLGSAAGGAAQGRMNEADLGLRSDALDVSRFNAGLQKNAADLDQRTFRLAAPGKRASNAVRGDILANAQNSTFEGLPDFVSKNMPTMTGGLQPSLLSPQSRTLGKDMARQALEEQLAGDQLEPMPLMPDRTDLPRAGAMENIGGVAGLGMSLAGAFGAKSNPVDDYYKYLATQKKLG